ncbi:glycosyltransferase family 4 protein [Bacillus mycoides]|uniref:glycosyltransferase family 4 protein n=1 Tax=Bacillus mycoides TaxID=1405 RepID=UPI0003E216AD|nr:glycosyltransferase family 4 protein [Bacillus mycoides]ETT71780.1 glycoside hydrolase family protein [Bacillus mycoides FSL H7-687]
MKDEIILVGPGTDSMGGVATHIRTLQTCFEENGKSVLIHDISGGNEKNFLLRKIKECSKIWGLRRVTKNKKDSVVHLNPSIYYGSLMKLWLILSIIKHENIIVQYHGGYFSELNLFKNKFIRFLFKKINTKPQKILFLSKDQKMEFEDVYPDVKLKVSLVPNFIDVRGIEKRNVFTDGKVKFLFLSRLIQEKGVFEVLEAAKLLQDKEVEFTIIGSGPIEGQVIEYIDKNNLHGIVRFVGAKFDGEKEEYLRASHVFILPSWREGIPYSVLEAMKFSLAIFCTPVGGLKEIIIDEGNGLFIQKDSNSIYQKVLYLLEDTDKINQFGGNAFDYASNYLSYEKAFNTFMSIYSETKKA